MATVSFSYREQSDSCGGRRGRGKDRDMQIAGTNSHGCEVQHRSVDSGSIRTVYGAGGGGEDTSGTPCEARDCLATVLGT